MKLAILGDTHFGARANNLHFHRNFKTFFDKVFFPHLKSNNIHTVIQLGDLFDQRKHVNFHTLQLAKKYFFDELNRLDIKLIAIVGNHDLYFKDSHEVNSQTSLLNEYSNITVVDSPTEYVFGDKKSLLVPWICDSNRDSIMSNISTTDATMLFGHFEFNGFIPFHGSNVFMNGLDGACVKRFDVVYSGHFHSHSIQNNIMYAGTPYPLNWSDYGENKYFFVLDTDDNSLEKVINPHTLFKTIEYKNDIVINDTIFNDVSGSYIKIKVLEPISDLYKFDMFIKKLTDNEPIDVKLIDMYEIVSDDEVQSDEVMTVNAAISKYINDNIKDDGAKIRLHSYISDLMRRVESERAD